MSQGSRPNRVADQIRAELALLLTREVHDPGIGFVTITRAGDTQARLLRDNVVVYEGKIGSLRRFKDDASEVKAGFECGIGFDKFNDLKVGDVIEVFSMERVAVTA